MVSKAPTYTAQTVHTDTPRACCGSHSLTSMSTLLKTIADSLDPNAHLAHDHNWNQQNIQRLQFLTYHQQLL